MTMPVYLPPLIGFLAGSIPFGLLVAKCKGVDIRKHGSGNIGATNVYRVVGKPYGMAVFILDFLKGLGPVLLAACASGGTCPTGSTCSGPGLAILTGMLAILGHNYSPWVGFRGGKGIATSAGVLAGLFPIALGVGLLVWVIVVKVTRYVSVASMAAAAAIPLTELTRACLSGKWEPLTLAFTGLIAVLAIWRHRSNIKNLRAGTEHRFGSKPSATPDTTDTPT